jgi:hypothetical protein
MTPLPSLVKCERTSHSLHEAAMRYRAGLADQLR